VTLENEQQLRDAYKHIARMYELIEMIERDTTGHPEGREDQIEGIRAMIRKIERQIAAYRAAHPEESREAEKAASSAR
jgi:hypothetical protein